jgi:GT2 family glycosyltransferase
MKSITLSIIIVSFNAAEVLAKCLKSLKSGCQGLRGGWEVILVDNASTDRSVEKVQNSKIKSQNYNSKFKIILNRENIGFSKAVNQGISQAKGRLALLLNPDIICQKGSITKLVNFAQKQKDLAAVGGRLLNPDQSAQASVFHLPTITGALKEFWLGQKDTFLKYLPKEKNPTKVEAVVGAVMLIPAQVLVQIGSLDERFFMYFEDLDFCRRAQKAGLGVFYHPTAQFIHFHGQSGKDIPAKVSQYLVKSSKIYHGAFKHLLINFIIWTGQKWQRTVSREK